MRGMHPMVLRFDWNHYFKPSSVSDPVERHPAMLLERAS
jgi:hypothetical protein